MNNFLSLWHNMVSAVSGATPALVFVLCLIFFVAVVYFSLSKLREEYPTAAILLSTFLCCFLMVPVISTLNHLAASASGEIVVDKAQKTVDSLENAGKMLMEEHRSEMMRIIGEIEKNNSELTKLNNLVKAANQLKEIEDIDNRMKLLENAKLSLEKTLRQPLLQSGIKHPLVRNSFGEKKKKEVLPAGEKGSHGSGWFGKAWDWIKDRDDWGSVSEDTLVAMIYDIEAKFGVDLSDVKVSKVSGGVAISGVLPKSVGASIHSEPVIVIREIRRLVYDTKGNKSSTIILHDRDAESSARAFSERHDGEFRKRLRDGEEFPFMEEHFVELAQTFIKTALTPLYGKDIAFVTVDRPGSLPLIEYLQKELTDNSERKNALSAEINRIKNDETVRGSAPILSDALSKNADTVSATPDTLSESELLGTVIFGGDGSDFDRYAGGFVTDIDAILSGVGGLKSGGDGGVGRKGVAGIGYGSGYGSGFGGGGGGIDELLGGLMGGSGGDTESKKTIDNDSLQNKKKDELKVSTPNFMKGATPLTGGRSRASIQRVVKQNMAALRDAYSKRLRDKPGLTGKITVKFAIDEFGKVIFAQIVESTMSDSKLESTVVSRVKNWNFEKIDKPGDVTEVTYPFVFSQ
jgi:TonB family protein